MNKPPRPDRQRILTVEGQGSCLVRDGEDALHALERQRLPWVTIGCRRGGCGICRVRVLAGPYHTLKMSRARVSEADEARGYALACRLVPDGDCTIVPAPNTPKPRSSS